MKEKSNHFDLYNVWLAIATNNLVIRPGSQIIEHTSCKMCRNVEILGSVKISRTFYVGLPETKLHNISNSIANLEP